MGRAGQGVSVVVKRAWDIGSQGVVRGCQRGVVNGACRGGQRGGHRGGSRGDQGEGVQGRSKVTLVISKTRGGLTIHQPPLPGHRGAQGGQGSQGG